MLRVKNTVQILTVSDAPELCRDIGVEVKSWNNSENYEVTFTFTKSIAEVAPFIHMEG